MAGRSHLGHLPRLHALLQDQGRVCEPEVRRAVYTVALVHDATVYHDNVQCGMRMFLCVIVYDSSGPVTTTMLCVPLCRRRALMQVPLRSGLRLSPSSSRPEHALHIKHYIIRNICNVSLIFSASYVKCPYYLGLCMQIPYCLLLYM